jgi:hypothetical protein
VVKSTLKVDIYSIVKVNVYSILLQKSFDTCKTSIKNSKNFFVFISKVSIMSLKGTNQHRCLQHAVFVNVDQYSVVNIELAISVYKSFDFKKILL